MQTDRILAPNYDPSEWDCCNPFMPQSEIYVLRRVNFKLLLQHTHAGLLVDSKRY